MHAVPASYNYQCNLVDLPSIGLLQSACSCLPCTTTSAILIRPLNIGLLQSACSCLLYTTTSVTLYDKLLVVHILYLSQEDGYQEALKSAGPKQSKKRKGDKRALLQYSEAHKQPAPKVLTIPYWSRCENRLTNNATMGLCCALPGLDAMGMSSNTE